MGLESLAGLVGCGVREDNGDEELVFRTVSYRSGSRMSEVVGEEKGG